jgi:ubiquinone/menaquinone biosynthesis C-methylase UbiE
MTDDEYWHDMAQYYDERANEYDELYEGKGPAFPDPEAYKNDVGRICEIAHDFGRGHLIDIACGTGFWLPYYASNCAEITLVDQSEKMLEVARRRASNNSVPDRCRFIRSNYFDASFSDDCFDSALLGFLVSHLTDTLVQRFFSKLLRILRKDSELLLIDSAWSKERRNHRQKDGIQDRTLNDGKSFKVYKRYFEKSEIVDILSSFGFSIQHCYFGKAFFVVYSVRQ